jgi:DNA-directed RNA polymerase specialized sigma24 family protein
LGEPAPDSFAGPRRTAFGSTRWSLVLQAGRGEGAPQRAAREELCATYWYPLYAWLRRDGHDAHAAADLVQGFFAEFLARDDLSGLEREGGRFRAFLRVALRRHVGRVREAQGAAKRGGGARLEPLDLDAERAERRYAREPAHGETPERLYERAFAVEVLASTLAGLRAEEAAAGRGERFARLEACLQGDFPEGGYAALAAQLGTTPNALKLAVARLRARWRAALAAAVARLVERPQDVEDEFAVLLAALEAPRAGGSVP